MLEKQNSEHNQQEISYSKFNGRLNNMRDMLYETLADPEKLKNFHNKDAILWMTNKCNSRCAYCYQDGADHGEVIPYDEAIEIINLLHGEGYYVNPIVNEWLPQYWHYMDLLKKCGVKQIASNGIVISQRHKEFFQIMRKNQIEDVRITIFPEQCHARYTGRERETTIKAIKLLKEAGFDVIANYLVTKDTLPHMKDIAEEVENLGADELYFQNFIYTGRAKQFKDAILDCKMIEEFWCLYNSIYSDYQDRELTINVQANFGPNPNGDNMFKRAAKLNNFCLAGVWKYLHHIYISPEKEVFPCMMLNDKKFKIGEVVGSVGNMSFQFDNLDKWTDIIPRFDRSNCASLLYMQSEIGSEVM